MGEFLNTYVFAHLPVLPVVLPLCTAVVLLLMGDSGGGESSHGGVHLHRRRLLSLASVVLGACMAWQLMLDASDGALAVYALGHGRLRLALSWW